MRAVLQRRQRRRHGHRRVGLLSAILGVLVLLTPLALPATATASTPPPRTFTTTDADAAPACDPSSNPRCVCPPGGGGCRIIVPIEPPPSEPGPGPVDPPSTPPIGGPGPGPGPGPVEPPPPGDGDDRVGWCVGQGLLPGTPEFEECLNPPDPPEDGEPPPVPPPTAGEVIELIAELQLPTPEIGSAPCSGGTCMGAVGLPVWLWTQPWETRHDSITIRGYTLTLTATPTQVHWSMGDGGAVTCTTAGIPYYASYGITHSPECGYMYTTTSAAYPGQAFTLEATMTYRVEWSGIISGSIDHTMTSSIPIRIGEYQTVRIG